MSSGNFTWESFKIAQVIGSKGLIGHSILKKFYLCFLEMFLYLYSQFDVLVTHSFGSWFRGLPCVCIHTHTYIYLSSDIYVIWKIICNMLLRMYEKPCSCFLILWFAMCMYTHTHTHTHTHLPIFMLYIKLYVTCYWSCIIWDVKQTRRFI